MAFNEIDEFVDMDAAEDSAMGVVGEVDLASVLVNQYLNQNHLDYNYNPFVGPFINLQKEGIGEKTTPRKTIYQKKPIFILRVNIVQSIFNECFYPYHVF